ncbi:MAG: DoxX family membrane protein [Bacteroidia bacterium]
MSAPKAGLMYKNPFQKLHDIILDNNFVYARIIIFVCFFGHGLVSLNISPGYQLHYNIFSAANFFGLDAHFFLRLLATFDICMAFLFLFNVRLVYIIPVILSYLFLVGLAGGIFYMKKTGGFFGISEFFRRLPWLFTVLFVWFKLKKERDYFFLLRVGLAFAFIAHGLSSLEFLGLRGGHIELASQIMTSDSATKFVYYSGFSDTVIGLLLITGLFSRWAAAIGCLWLVFIVYLSFLTGLPEGIFRTGFLLICLYVAVDKRCHQWKNSGKSI